MNKPLIIENHIQIKATPAKIWDALVNPDQTKKYMFGCETVSDWKVGGPLLWKGSYEGKEMTFVKGNIVALEPGRHLSYTVIDPNSTMEDIPENYLTVTYDLKGDNEYVTLTVTQGDYSTVADGDKRYQDSYNGGEGWNPILVAIKELVEKDND